MTITRCEMSHSLRKHGLSADGCPCNVEVIDCKLLENKQRGVVVHDGACVNLRGCSSSGNGAGGYCVQSKWSTVTLDIRDCSSDNDGEGCRVTGVGATCVAEGLLVRQSAMYGLHVFDQATADFDNCTLQQCGTAGAYFSGDGTKGVMRGCTVERNGEAGVWVGVGAHALLQHVVSSGHEVCGFRCTGVDSKLEAENCQILDYVKFDHDLEATIIGDGKRDVRRDGFFAKIFTCFG